MKEMHMISWPHLLDHTRNHRLQRLTEPIHIECAGRPRDINVEQVEWVAEAIISEAILRLIVGRGLEHDDGTLVGIGFRIEAKS